MAPEQQRHLKIGNRRGWVRIDNLSVRLRYEAFLERMLLSREETDFQRFLDKKR